MEEGVEEGREADRGWGATRGLTLKTLGGAEGRRACVAKAQGGGDGVRRRRQKRVVATGRGMHLLYIYGGHLGRSALRRYPLRLLGGSGLGWRARLSWHRPRGAAGSEGTAP